MSMGNEEEKASDGVDGSLLFVCGKEVKKEVEMCSKLRKVVI